MGQNLVIVESPAKAKTIAKYLGKNYVVEASMGHVRDLPKSKLGVDIEDNFNPKYITIRGKGELIDKTRFCLIYYAEDGEEYEDTGILRANPLRLERNIYCSEESVNSRYMINGLLTAFRFMTSFTKEQPSFSTCDTHI